MTANVMTGGGPAGSTTTVEYYLYQTAFEKFNMGYASAIAWFLFAVILRAHAADLEARRKGGDL